MDFIAGTHDNAAVAPAQPDRRRTERTVCEPLRVRLNVYREGTLIDLSQGGALVNLQSEPPPIGTQVTLAIEWSERTLHLPARMVRSIARGVQNGSAAQGQTEYQVALEFLTPGADAASDLARLIAVQTRRARAVDDDDATKV